MLRSSEGFESILDEGGDPGKESIVNMIVRSAQVKEKEPELKIKVGKKGKKVLIEKVDWRKL